MRWRTRPGWRRRSAPAIVASPAVGSISVASMRSVVVFPAPLGPRKPKISPEPTWRSTPATASTGPVRVLKVRFRSVVSIIAVRIAVGFVMLTLLGAVPDAVAGTTCTVQHHGSISEQCRYLPSQEPLSTMKRENVDSVLRSLRRVNIQGSFLGQTVAIRFGLSESDIETLEQLIDMGATTAGKLSEITGLTSGAVTRVIDRLEQAGYVRRVPDPTDRRRVIVEVVPETVANIQVTLDRVTSASAQEIRDYSDDQLALIADFLTRMEAVTREEAEALRESSGTTQAGGRSTSEHFAPLGGLTEAKLAIRSGLSSLRLRP